MSSRLPVAAGLVSGVLAAVALFVVLVAVIPAPGSAGASPSLALGTADPSAAASPESPGPSPSGPITGSASPSAASSAGPAAFHIGEAAPALAVPQLGGGTIDLAALRGKPVWVNFMATWCPPCVDEFPLMNGFAARYADEGLVVVAIDVREDEADVAAFAQELEATFPIGLDGDGSAQDAWDALALPVHFWVDAEGIVRDGALGGIGPDVMARGLGAILPGVEVTP